MSFTSCDDEVDGNVITISFLEPTDEEVVDASQPVHVHIQFEASDENHNVEVKLHPEGDASNLIIDYDLHEHDALIDAEFDVDLSMYPSGTEFHVEALACIDHDCDQAEEADIHFTIQ